MNERQRQQGVGVLEVMIALALIMFTAMAVGNMLTSSMVSARISSVHFAIDSLSSEMLETLRAQSIDAQAGSFDFDGAAASTDSESTETATTDTSVLPVVSSWNNRIVEAIPGGVGSISCTAGFCDVAISWLENIDGATHRQAYRTRTPL